MNMKEIEALVIAQGALIKEQAASIEALKTGQDEAVARMTLGMQDVESDLSTVTDSVQKLTAMMGADEEDGPFYPELKALRAMLDDLGTKVNATNKSAPSKRNMTDADAISVLTGEYKELAHKEAAEKIGLTYAQVYSCRLEFTFKHVHKELRDGGWKNPYVK